MSKKKRKAKQQNITKWIKENRTNKIKGLIETINRKLVGLYAYYGINGMLDELYKIYYHTLYALRSSISLDKIQEVIKVIRQVNKTSIIHIDNFLR